MFNYILSTIASALMLAYLALFLHPAKAYILPGILGQMGITESGVGGMIVLKIIPIVLCLILIMALIRPGNPRRQRYVAVLLVFGALILTGYQTFLKAQPGGWPQTPPGVDVEIVTLYPFSDRIQALGTTEANESTQLTSNVSETVKSINFSEGQFVTKGTVIAELHDDEERASLTEAEKSYNRSAALARTAAISTARRDQDRARLDITKAQMKDRQIIVPFDGILGLRSISVGDIVSPGMVITTLDDIDPMKLEFSIPESYLASVRSGMKIDAHSDAYPDTVFTGTITAIDPRIDAATRSLKLKAEIPNPDGKLRAGMLLSTEIVNNERRALAVSEEALVSQGTEKSVRVASPPQGDDKLSDVIAQPVKIGARMPGYVEITDGLKAGDTVVVNGVMKANPGGKVKINKTIKIDDNITRAVNNAPHDKRRELNNLGTSPDADPTATSAVPAVETLPAPSELESTPALDPTPIPPTSTGE